jgi:hypothetical protein
MLETVVAASGAIIVGSAVNVPGSGRPVDRTYVAGMTPVATVTTKLELVGKNLTP